MAKARLNWAEKLSEIKNLQGIYPVGDDWFTSREFMDKFNFAESKGYRLIRKALDANKLEAFTGSRWSDRHQQCYRQVWYRFTDPK
jgi:hypothetical protein